MVFIVSWKTAPQKTSTFQYLEPYLNKGLFEDVIKLRIVVWRLSQIILCPKHHHKSLNKREAEGNDTTEEKEPLCPCRKRLEGCCHNSGNAGSHQRPEEARNGFSPRASGGSTVLPMPWFWSRVTNFKPMVSRTMREYTVLSHQVYGNLLQQPWETNRVCSGWILRKGTYPLWSRWFLNAIIFTLIKKIQREFGDRPTKVKAI